MPEDNVANLTDFELMAVAEREGCRAFERSHTRLGISPSNPFDGSLNRWAWDLGWRWAALTQQKRMERGAGRIQNWLAAMSAL